MVKFIIIFNFLIFLLFGKNALSLDNKYKLEILKSNLSSPWSFTFINNNQILISEKTGKIKLFDIQNNKITAIDHNLDFIRKNFRNDENQNIQKQFSKIINDFPDSKWKIKRLKSNIPNKEILRIKVSGEKIVNGKMHILESDFDYVFSVLNRKIGDGTIRNLFTTIRNDDKKIDISFKIPDKVLTGSKYDIDIILNKPLEEVIIAGAIKPHQVNSLFEQEMLLVPLASGGIFKITRAPSKPGMQIWSGIIAHPEGMITFTKSIDIVDEI